MTDPTRRPTTTASVHGLTARDIKVTVSGSPWVDLGPYACAFPSGDTTADRLAELAAIGRTILEQAEQATALLAAEAVSA